MFEQSLVWYDSLYVRVSTITRSVTDSTPQPRMDPGSQRPVFAGDHPYSNNRGQRTCLSEHAIVTELAFGRHRKLIRTRQLS